MSVLFVVIPLAFIFSAAAVGAYIWAVHADQFEDLGTPAMRILFDEAAPRDDERG